MVNEIIDCFRQFYGIMSSLDFICSDFGQIIPICVSLLLPGISMLNYHINNSMSSCHDLKF